MLAFIKGRLVNKSVESVIIEVGGVGYRILMSSNGLSSIGNTSTEVQVFTHLQVREDMLSLYGFLIEEELRFFETLIQVSGIGPKGALAILGSFTPNVLQKAILEENAVLLAKAQGIGKKTAQRIILELKDKIGKVPFNVIENHLVTGSHNNQLDDALAALESLGYSIHEANQALNIALEKSEDKVTTEQLIKLGLKQLAQT